MFESSLINALKADGALTALVTVFEGQAAIFSEYAPDKAELPYIVCSISRTAEYEPIQSFNILIDFFDFNKLRVNSRKAAERIEFDLDQKILTHERYDDIRISFFSGSPVESEDPRDVHYNLQFYARATRKKWIINH